MNGVRWVDSKTLLEDFGFVRAIAAISEALESGYDPETDHSRSVISFAEGQGLVMPSEYMGRVGLKFVTVAPKTQQLVLIESRESTHSLTRKPCLQSCNVMVPPLRC